MQFTINQETLSKALNSVGRSVATRSTMPILSNILIRTKNNQLIITASDMETSNRLTLDAQVDEEGACTLDYKKAAEIIGKLPNSPITFKLDPSNHTVELSCLKSRYVLRSLNAEEFPEVPEPSANGATVESKVLRNAIRETAFSASSDDTRHILTGVYLLIEKDGLELVATDGHRLARSVSRLDNEAEKIIKVIIPSKVMTELSRLLSSLGDVPVHLSLSKNEIIFSFGNQVMTSKLIDGQFPDYRSIIPKNLDRKAVVNRSQFLSSIERAAIMAEDRSNIIKLKYNPSELEITSDTPELGKGTELLEIQYDGEENLMAFNARYLIDILKNLDDAEVNVEMKGAFDPCLVRPNSEKEFIYVVMPIRLN